MHWLTLRDWVTVLLTYGLDALLLIVLARRRILRRVWPLALLISTHLLTYPVGMTVAWKCSPTTYMHVYCGLGLLDAVLQFAVISEVFRRLRRPHSWANCVVALFAVGALALIAYGVIGAPFHPHSFFDSFLLLSRDLALLRMILCLGVVAYAWICAVHWSRTDLRVFLGIMLAVFGEFAIAESQIITNFTGYDLTKYMPTIVYWFAVAVWTCIPSNKGLPHDIPC